MTEPRFLVTVSFVFDVDFVLPGSGTAVSLSPGEVFDVEIGLTDYVWLAGLPGKIQWHAVPVAAFPSQSPN